MTLVAMGLSAFLPAVAEPFNLVVIPDSQWASQDWPEVTRKMAEWIVANKELLFSRSPTRSLASHAHQP